MAVLIVLLDEKDREWRGPPDGMKNVYQVKLDLAQLEFTDAEIELHATTLVKMLLKAIQPIDDLPFEGRIHEATSLEYNK